MTGGDLLLTILLAPVLYFSSAMVIFSGFKPEHIDIFLNDFGSFSIIQTNSHCYTNCNFTDSKQE